MAVDKQDSYRYERERERESELVLSPNEYAFILDKTKGNINVYVGPHKVSLAGTDSPVQFDPVSKTFQNKAIEECIKLFSTAPKGWYIQLKNPEINGKQPDTGKVSSSSELLVGNKVNIPGPAHFALWPGQMVKVIKGHHLRSNQYLVVRVYDEEAAKKNWRRTIAQPQITEGDKEEDIDETNNNENNNNNGNSADNTQDEDNPINIDMEKITAGKLFVIKGTDVSFYIPPTGIEVVPDGYDADNKPIYVREAVSLERLEYCILLDEDGSKTYVRGEDVVFPKPTQVFVLKKGGRKFRALELNEISGIYVKVIKPYKDEETGKAYKEGEELFLTGKDQMIYFPRPEHAIIKYGDKDVHYAIAIPAGEGRYVLNRNTGAINIKRGPCMFLPDPRKEVVVRRILSEKTVQLYYPGNTQAIQYNRNLKTLSMKKKKEFVTEKEIMEQEDGLKEELAKESIQSQQASLSPEVFYGDELTRRKDYTPPRMITLESKYDGAVTINIWTGYAIQVVSKSGERKVVVGPQTYMLEYDEYLETLSLSTGTPKNSDNLLKTVYLRIKNNKISDLITVQTKDFVDVDIMLSYRANFEGNPQTFFEVENYVKFMTDHLRSLIKREVLKRTIQDFYTSSTDIIRDIILGTPNDDGGRAGCFFEENGCRVYDVEVLETDINDDTIEGLLIDAQHNAVRQAIDIERERNSTETTKVKEELKREIIETRLVTAESELKSRLTNLKYQAEVIMKELNDKIAKRKLEISAKLDEQENLNEIHKEILTRNKEKMEQTLEFARQELEQKIKKIVALAESDVKRLDAIQPELVASLNALRDSIFMESVTQKELVAMSFLEGRSLGNMLLKLFQGTPIEKTIKDVVEKSFFKEGE